MGLRPSENSGKTERECNNVFAIEVSDLESRYRPAYKRLFGVCMNDAATARHFYD